MATLPDFDAENEAGYVAYYKADSTPDIQNFVSNTNLNNYTIYDNGITGTITEPQEYNNTPVIWRFRIKTDGWIVLYMPQDGYTSDFYNIIEEDYGTNAAGWTSGLYTRLGVKNASVYYLHQDADTSNAVLKSFEEYCSSLNVSPPGTFSEIGIYDYNETGSDSLAVMMVKPNGIQTTISMADVSEINLAHSIILTRAAVYINETMYGDDGIVAVDLQQEVGLSPGDSFTVNTKFDTFAISVYYNP